MLLLGEEGSDTETEKGRVTEKSLSFFLICSDVTRNSLPISFKINFFCSLASPRNSSFFVHFRHLNHLQLSFISCLKFSWNIKIYTTIWIDRCTLYVGKTQSMPDTKLYIPSAPNIDIILWHTQLIVCAENIKSWFKSWVFPLTFQAYILLYTLDCMCVSLSKFHIWILEQF